MKPNVLQLIGSFNQGGSERQAVQLTRLLHESKQFNLHVACLDESGVLRSEVEGLNLGKVESFPLTNFYNAQAARQIKRFKNFARERHISLIHTHDFYTNVFGIAAATVARVPHRIASRREIVGWRSPKQKQVERFCYRFAHRIVANAEAVKANLIREHVPADKISVIHNGMDVERIVAHTLDRTAARRRLESQIENTGSDKLKLYDEAGVVTIVANLHHEVKDHRTFLRAAAAVKRRLPQTHFVIAGEGALTEELKSLAAQLGIFETTHFIGRCADVASLLAASDVCVLSSVSEGFSNSILEYMAASRPVVVTDVGGAREAVIENESGFIVAPRDDVSLAERVIYLLQNRERAIAMGKRGRQIVEENFSLAAQLSRTVKLYENLLAA